jgi:flavorubredoxin
MREPDGRSPHDRRDPPPRLALPSPTGLRLRKSTRREGRRRHDGMSAHDSRPAAERPVITFPREVSPGIHWFSTCLEILDAGHVVHNHNSCFLIIGETATALVDSGMPFGWDELHQQIRSSLGGRSLDYLFPTHPESPHMGNSGPLLDAYPNAVLIGDLRNYHLYYPAYQDRFRTLRAGEEIDLGGRRLRMVPAVVHDLPNTLWAYDTRDQMLFVGDGYPYTHDHKQGECALTAEELVEPVCVEDTLRVLEGALAWSRDVDAAITIAALDELLADLPVRIIGPTHGGVITDPQRITDVFKAGLRRVRGDRHV